MVYVGIYAAAAMVIGANVGTTSTAVIAVIGATSNAKRVASAHIVFNAGTGLVALLILPVLFWIVDGTGELLGLEAIPAVTLALFHTVFNILGVLLMLPINTRLASFLEKRFVTQDEVEGRPRYLDKTVAVSPELAINALTLELARLSTVVRRMGLAALSSESIGGRRIATDDEVVQKLATAVSEFIGQLEREVLSQEISAQLARVLRAEQHLLACSDQALLVARAQRQLQVASDELLVAGNARFRAQVVSLMTMANPEETGFSVSECEAQLAQVQTAYDDHKAALLLAGADLRISIPAMIDIIDQNSRIRRMARQMAKAMYLFEELAMNADKIGPAGGAERSKAIDDD